MGKMKFANNLCFLFFEKKQKIHVLSISKLKHFEILNEKQKYFNRMEYRFL